MNKDEAKKVLPKKKQINKKEVKENLELEKKIESLTKENKELEDKLLRVNAEFQNAQRRFQEDKSKLLKYDGENIILAMLTHLDNFEHAINMDDANLTDELSKFLSGFKMIYANMSDALKNVGVEEIECLHEPFDESCMNAVLVDHEEGLDDNMVIDVLQKGYRYKDKVIRHAMVKVNHKESDK